MDEDRDVMHISDSVPLADRETLVARIAELEKGNAQLGIANQGLQNCNAKPSSAKFVWGSVFGAAVMLTAFVLLSVSEWLGTMPLLAFGVISCCLILPSVIYFFIKANLVADLPLNYTYTASTYPMAAFTVFFMLGIFILGIFMFFVFAIDDVDLQKNKNAWKQAFERVEKIKAEMPRVEEIAHPKKRMEY